MPGATVRMDAVRFAYPGGVAMNFDLDIGASSVIALMGPSGSGKSTALNLIAGFEPIGAGRILIGGTDLTTAGPAQRPISMVFQENNLFAHLNVADNVGLGRSPSLKLSADDHADIEKALSDTGLDGKAERKPSELSGGERQRVALARALVRRSPVLLLDEPFASLGPALRNEMLDLLRLLHEGNGMTTIMVTHNPDDARRVADRIVFLEEGNVAADGPPSLFFGLNPPPAFIRYAGA